jgi:hypothetical protein
MGSLEFIAKVKSQILDKGQGMVDLRTNELRRIQA